MSTQHNEPERLLATRADAAIALGVSESTVKRLMNNGEIPFVRVGSRPMVSWAYLHDLAREACKRRHPSTGGDR